MKFVFKDLGMVKIPEVPKLSFHENTINEYFNICFTNYISIDVVI